MNILRLLVTKRCRKHCPECCNNNWDLDALETEYHFHGYDQILLTGGEPMLVSNRVIDVVAMIRKQTIAPIYMYTAKLNDIGSLLRVLSVMNGITITLHDQSAVNQFIEFNHMMRRGQHHHGKSLRLNVFKGVDMLNVGGYLDTWKVKDNMVWIKNCPLPKDETFKRI